MGNNYNPWRQTNAMVYSFIKKDNQVVPLEIMIQLIALGVLIPLWGGGGLVVHQE